MKMLILCCVCLLAFSGLASARICLPVLAAWDDDCQVTPEHPGEPPAYCNEYPEGSWMRGWGWMLDRLDRMWDDVANKEPARRSPVLPTADDMED